MKFKSYSKRAAIVALIFSLSALLAFGQAPNLTAPREEKLLNGMKLLVWNEPKAAKVTVKLRIHSGSAFDPLGKEGVMQLLADILFPNESIKGFFAEDLGGSLEVTSNYDYIQISAIGDADKALQILEVVATAVTAPQITKENTEKVRTTLLSRLREMEKDPAYVADRAAAKRLLGNFPYGRPQLGSVGTVSQIDFADLLFAQQRFLTADNTTLAIAGNIRPDLALRATKRFFGGWLKADKKIPATFAQPEAPDTSSLEIDAAAEHKEFRYALRGLARNDKDFFASAVLSRILRDRLAKTVSVSKPEDAFVRQSVHLLPGYVVFGVSNVEKLQVAMPGEPAQKKEPLVKLLFGQKITGSEFDQAKAKVLADLARKEPAEWRLDVDTFRLESVKTDWQNAQNVTLADVQRVADRFLTEPVVSVVVAGAKTAQAQ